MSGKEPKALARRRRVVVTGIGAVTAAGWGVAAFRDAARSGVTAVGPFTRFPHHLQRTHVAGQVPPQPPDPQRRANWTRLSNSDRFALYAAFEAADQARLDVSVTGASAVFFGSSTGGLLETEHYYAEMMRQGSCPDRSLLASHQISAPAETVARHLGVGGPVETVSSACASGGLAIEQAYRSVGSGEVDVALAGGADCLCVTTYTGFNALRAVDDRPCRPFSTGRGGLSLGEGGAVLVLESAEHAAARGVRPLVEVLGAGASCDATHMTAPQAEGLWAASAIQAALDDAGLEPAAIDYVNAHGTGTPLNDAAEYATLRRVFGGRSRRLPIEATKGIVGHLLGAAGAIEAVAVTLALLDGAIHPTPGLTPVDAALAVDLVREVPRTADLRTAISLSLGFGGANAALVLGRWGHS